MQRLRGVKLQADSGSSAERRRRRTKNKRKEKDLARRERNLQDRERRAPYVTNQLYTLDGNTVKRPYARGPTKDQFHAARVPHSSAAPRRIRSIVPTASIA